jgi:hypothetical protein
MEGHFDHAMPTARQSPRHRSRKRIVIEITPRDVRIFQLLQRYRYLPSNFITALIGGSHRYLIKRLGELYHAGYLNRPEQQWHAINARYKPAVYELDAAAEAVLRELGLQRYHQAGRGRHFHHELMVCLITASIELGCRAHNLQFVSWEQILDHERTPEATKSSPAPFNIPVSMSGNARLLRPDGRPFALRADTSLCFPGFEADRATEPLEPMSIERRTNIEMKFRLYLEIARAGIYRSHFGFPNMIVPIITTAERRMCNMMKLLAKLTNGTGSSFIIFKTMPDQTSFDTAPQPSPTFLAEPWERVGHPRFDLLRELSPTATIAAVGKTS